MTQENAEKDDKAAAKSAELTAVRYAAMLWHLTQATDAQLAKEVGTTVDVIAHWKRSREWEEVLQQIAKNQLIPTPSPMLALTAYEHQALQTALPNAAIETREKAAQALLSLERTSTKTSSKSREGGRSR